MNDFKIGDYALSTQPAYNESLKDMFFKVVDIQDKGQSTWVFVEGINNKIPFNLPLIHFGNSFVKVNASTVEVLFGKN